MQPARFNLHAEERTCNPVQRPNFTVGVMHLPWPKRRRWAVTGITTLSSSATKTPAFPPQLSMRNIKR
jgi:hypothetical protein